YWLDGVSSVFSPADAGSFMLIPALPDLHDLFGGQISGLINSTLLKQLFLLAYPFCGLFFSVG
ncbi:MAG: hypothetical protein VKP70_12285, partial [Cyanobacteriota bacterium]|nr:hypothetical protein [Cyanobacteriota bacterium]